MHNLFQESGAIAQLVPMGHFQKADKMPDPGFLMYVEAKLPGVNKNREI